MLEWIRFVIVTALIFAALFIEAMAILGVSRFRYSLNRVHAAGMGDTLAAFCIVLASVFYTGFDLLSMKLLLVIGFLWMTSPMSGHLIALLVFRTDHSLESEVRLWKN